MDGGTSRGSARGNIALSARSTGLPKDSVANVSSIVALDRHRRVEFVATLPRRQLDLILSGIDTALGR